MQKKELIRNLIYFLSGVITSLIVLLIAFMLDTKAGEVIPLNTPRSFGDIRIWVEKGPANQEENYDVSEAMYMAKTGKPFLMVAMNNVGKVVSLSLLEGESIRFTTTASDKPGKWERGIYGGGGYGYTTGECYVDINFDGHFDKKNVFDNAGRKVAREIYIDGIWQPVDHVDFQKAVSGQIKYTFNPDYGWRKEKF
jgi:hypothetical protein